MGTNIIFLIIALVLGALVTWLWSKANLSKQLQLVKDAEQEKYNTLDKEFTSFKATATNELDTNNKTIQKLNDDVLALNKAVEQKQDEYNKQNGLLATATANNQAANDTLSTKLQEIEQQKKDLAAIREERDTNNRLLATAQADNKALEEKFETQKQEIEKLNEKFTTEFENIANKILDTKTQKFTDLNKENLKGILEPLGKNIDEFKKQVDKVYNDESKERFSLGEKVKELAELNKVISEEAHNLTKALKGESKTQGRWGEVILETILEKSGLRKGEEYFMEYQLFDAEGKPLRSEAEGKKMRPDALVMYPDNRHIVIDSKVSLNAFVRFVESDDATQQKIEKEAHVAALKSHINDLSKKAYDDYDKTLDFVMMFIPNEPAYITAMQVEPDLWSYAYERRILLISPTNLIASLKLMVDLWKREYQNQNAQAIAERGSKMYDKFVGFIDNLEAVGTNLDRAQAKYKEAFGQLSTGRDNLVGQATKLQALGVKVKKEIPVGMSELALQNDAEVTEIKE
jgi:DNA recombination protein RmuC